MIRGAVIALWVNYLGIKEGLEEKILKGLFEEILQVVGPAVSQAFSNTLVKVVKL